MTSVVHISACASSIFISGQLSHLSLLPFLLHDSGQINTQFRPRPELRSPAVSALSDSTKDLLLTVQWRLTVWRCGEAWLRSMLPTSLRRIHFDNDLLTRMISSRPLAPSRFP